MFLYPKGGGFVELKCEACNITFENEDKMKEHAKEAHGKGDDHE